MWYIMVNGYSIFIISKKHKEIINEMWHVNEVYTRFTNEIGQITRNKYISTVALANCLKVDILNVTIFANFCF